MESCLLCLDINKDILDSIKASSTRWQELDIAKVIEKHFWPMNLQNIIQPSSWICLSCWQELEDFHKFYMRVEEAHMNFAKIKVEDYGETVIYNDQFTIQEVKIKDAAEVPNKVNMAFCCLEPEILIDQPARPHKIPKLELLDEHDLDDMPQAGKRLRLENELANEDPLEKTETYKVNKIMNRKSPKAKASTEENLEVLSKMVEIKEEPVDINEENDNNYSDSLGDYEESYDSQQTDQNVSESDKQKGRKEGDKLIAEHFDHMFCDLCDFPFENFSGMTRHFATVHDRRGYLVCCNKKFYERNHLVDHIHCHLNPDHFKCVQCGKVLSDRRNFKNHMLQAHRPDDVILKHSCETCGKSFAQGYDLRKHQLTHLPKEEKKFPCSICGKHYGSASLLKLHTEVVHLKKHAKVCHICGKTLGTSTEYKAHMNKHEGIPAAIINCDVCGLRLTSERSLKLHKESQHPVGGKQDHPCPVCHKISPTARALKKHISTMHEKGYDHKCSMCEKAFRRAETLKEHIASQHAGTSLYTCPWCPKTFNSNGNMHAHRKNVHPKESLELKLQKYSNIPPPPKIQNIFSIGLMPK